MRTKSHYKLTKQKYLTEDEYATLHKRMANLLLIPGEKRNALLVFTALYTGARAQEILNLRPQDLDSRDKTVYIHGLKSSDDREIPLPDWLFAGIKAEATSPHVFGISYPSLDRVWRSIRTTKKKFHSLRHTFALRLYQRTKDLRLVQKALGHRDISNTLIYTDYLYTKEEMRRHILE